MFWAALDLARTNNIRTDYGLSFTSICWSKLTSNQDIELKISSIELHNLPYLIEGYHTPFRRIYRKL